MKTNLSRQIKKLAKDEGARAVGISSIDRLTAKPSMDASYLLPGARSIVSLMLPLDGKIIRDYLGKINHDSYQHHETEVYRNLFSIGQTIANFLKQEGYQAVVAEPNLDYRYKDSPEYKMAPFKAKQAIMEWFASDSNYPITLFKKTVVPTLLKIGMRSTNWNLTPSFSHRYGAVAAGIGYLGWSGNVLHPAYGARVLYNTVITDSNLKADSMLEQNPCDGCRICTKVCQSNFIHPKIKDHVTIGGETFTHNQKAHNLRCIFVCGGFSGQNEYKGWSTWSPGRLDLPKSDDNLEDFWMDFGARNLWKRNYYSYIFNGLLSHSEFGFIRKKDERFPSTCGNCQLVCWKTREQRKKNYDILINSGVVEEGPNFSFKVMK